MTKLLWFIVLFLIVPQPVLAWGPGMHFFLGQRLLELGLVGGTLGTLLRSHRKDFLYGNIVADVIVGKNMIDYENHSHNWDTARSLRERAEGPSQKAFAIGYWTHLAADTVAHNSFLNEQQTPSRITTPTMDHVYLELQVDTWIPESIPSEVKDLLGEDFQSHRSFLQQTVPQTILPFALNWFLTDRFLNFTGRGTTRNLARVLRTFHPEDYTLDRMEFYSDLCLDRMRESLEPNPSSVLRINPVADGDRVVPAE